MIIKYNTLAMKKLIFLSIIVLIYLNAFAQVGINETGASPHNTAMLDVSSTTKGMLIPRMNNEQMTTISNPAIGLLVFNTDYNCFFFANENGWKKLITESSNNTLYDADGDSFLTLRYDSGDDDTLRIFFQDIEKFKISARGIEPLNNGKSVFFGENAGKNEPGNENFSTALGYNSMLKNTTGYHNAAVGAFALQQNQSGFANNASGYAALQSNTSGNSNSAFGYSTLVKNSEGNLNTAFGGFAMWTNKMKSRNTALGYGAMMFADSTDTAFDSYNTGIGTHALRGSENPINNTGIYNTAVGGRAMNENASGSNNSALGYHTMFSNSSGESNVGMGFKALYSNTDRSFIVAIGDNALYSNGLNATEIYHGTENTAIGSKSLYSNTIGYKNTAVGFNSLYTNSTGIENTALGSYTLYSNTSGNYNTAIGNVALNYNISGSSNTAVGNASLFNNESGESNAALGVNALLNNVSGSYNTAIGYAALQQNTSQGNTALGYGTLMLNEGGWNNTAVGINSGEKISSGNHNITVGYHAGKNITTGSYNVIIGDYLDAPSATANYQMVLGAADMLYGDITNKRIGIGTTTPAAILHAHGTGTGGGNVLFTGQRKTSGAGDPPASGAGTRLMWYPDQAAFRAGGVEGTQWDKANLGSYSAALGFGTKATAASCIALGYSTSATNDFATAMGVNSTASGHSSTVMGSNTSALSFVETVVGQYNTTYTPGNVNDWNSSDRLFVVANGTSHTARSNAMTILKNGNTGIATASPNEKLEVAGNIHLSGADRTIFNRSNNYLALGTNNLERMRITSTGNVGIGTTPNTNALLHTSGTGTSGGNVLFVGSYKATPGEPPTTGAGTRMMWYPDKAAFRAGYVDGAQWNTSSIGTYSVAMGYNTTASGARSVAMGSGTYADGSYSTALGVGSSASGTAATALGNSANAGGNYSVAIGDNAGAGGLNAFAIGTSTSASGDYAFAGGRSTLASGYTATALGFSNTASGNYSTALNYYTSAPSFAETVIGQYNTTYTPDESTLWDTDDRLFVIGNGTSTSNRKNAMTVLKNGKIGIGTDSPGEIFHINSGSGSVKMRLSGAAGAFLSEMQFYSGTTYKGAIGSDNDEDYVYIYQNGNIFFKNGRIGIQSVNNPTYAIELPNSSVIGTGTGRAYAWITYSDGRLKSSKSQLAYGLKEVMKLQPVSYFHHESEIRDGDIIIKSDGKNDFGFIAQDIYKIIPELVNKPENEKTDLWSMNYEKLTPVLVKAIQEQQSEIDELKKIVQQQQAQISALLELNANKTASR